MLGPPKASHRDELFLDSLDQRLPATNCYRKLDATLDLSFVRAWVADQYAAIGRPSIDPVVCFPLQLMMFFDGIRSERLLMETADLNIAHRWYLGYGWAEPLPDHSSLTRIRQRLGGAVFQQVFDRVVELCQAAGLVWGKELFFDSTKVRANADADSLTPRFAQAAREHITQLFAGDAAHAPDSAPADPPAADQSGPTGVPVVEGAAAAEDCGGPLVYGPQAPVADTVVDMPGAGATAAPTALPFTGTPAEHAQLVAANQAQWKLLEQHRLDPQRPPSGAPGGYRRITDCRVSTTDADATPLNKDDTGKLGYRDHYVVDGGKARIIVGVLVTPADVQDNQALLDPLDRARFRFHLHVKRAVADRKYATIENLRGVEQRGIRASMPLVEYRKTGPLFRQQDFLYDPATDS
jgi:transposase